MIVNCLNLLIIDRELGHWNGPARGMLGRLTWEDGNMAISVEELTVRKYDFAILQRL